MEGGARRLTLWDQMSAVDGGGAREALSGLTLNDVLRSTAEKRAAAAAAAAAALPAPPAPQLSNRTLLDVIREQDQNTRSSFKNLLESHHDHDHDHNHNGRDKKAWKSFKEKLRLKRAGAAWTSSVPIPASDIPIQNSNIRDNNSRLLSLSRGNSVRFQYSAEPTQSEEDPSCSSSSSGPGFRPQITRRSSTRFGQLLASIPSESTQDGDSDNSDAAPSRVPSLRPQISRHNSTRFLSTQRQNSMYNRDAIDDDDEDEDGEEARSPHTRQLAAVLAEERSLSAREAVAAQEAAEAAAAAEREGTTEDMVETEGSAPAPVPVVRMSLMDLMDYNMADEDEDEEAEEEEEEEVVVEVGGGGAEHNCCVCMVRHKGAAFIPCGHTFCRLCSRELMVCRGNCPLCNRFILEILDIF
ncbi:hypothetical protein FH972_002580 [Carpinus fangiana]|uniref:RING-type domain-containing protein n=1 Tax=Carpinus fangiana TaxID=176857 RepID=A0A5N6QIR2_9ROSI|nr:hypothetical protein FH972_002580 [Carpinus fangiana]